MFFITSLVILYAVYFLKSTPFFRPTFLYAVYFSLIYSFYSSDLSSTQFIFFNLLLLFVRSFLYAVYFLDPTPFIRPTFPLRSLFSLSYSFYSSDLYDKYTFSFQLYDSSPSFLLSPFFTLSLSFIPFSPLSSFLLFTQTLSSLIFYSFALL